MKKTIIFYSLLAIFFSVPLIHAADVLTKNTSTKNSLTRYKYRLKISFMSIGAGIDNESYEKITGFIKSHPKKPKYQEYQKGKEGERYIFMRLDELNESERKTFIEDVRKLVVNREIVKIEDSEKMRKAEKFGKIAEVTQAVPVVQKSKYPLIVSFISVGHGVDHKTMEKLDTFLSSHPKKPVSEKVRWGREGEIDYQFELKEFSTDSQKDFIAEVKKLIGTTDLVKISEGPGRVKK